MRAESAREAGEGEDKGWALDGGWVAAEGRLRREREARTPPPDPRERGGPCGSAEDAFCERPLRLAPRATICWGPPGRRSGASSVDQERSEERAFFRKALEDPRIPGVEKRKGVGSEQEKEIFPGGRFVPKAYFETPHSPAVHRTRREGKKGKALP